MHVDHGGLEDDGGHGLCGGNFAGGCGRVPRRGSYVASATGRDAVLETEMNWGSSLAGRAELGLIEEVLVRNQEAGQRTETARDSTR